MEKRQRRGLFRGSFFFALPLLRAVAGSERAASARRSLTAGAQRPSERGGGISTGPA